MENEEPKVWGEDTNINRYIPKEFKPFIGSCIVKPITIY